jgi:hypothetical protein
MSLEHNIVHRKVFDPWYDTDSMCAATMFFSVLIFLFCLAGISVCEGEREFRGYIWIPTLLLALCGGLFVSIFVRMVKRVVTRYQNRYLKDFSRTGL